MARKISYAILVASCILFLFCGESFADAGGIPSVSSSAGLSAPYDERAEDILLQAHRRDINAMALAVAGYAKGVGGFPRDTYLAAVWGHLLLLNNGYGAGALTTLLLWEETKIPDDGIGVKLTLCEKAKKSSLAPLFKRSVLFDVDTFCAAFDAQKQAVPGWEKEYREAKAVYEEGEQAGVAAMDLMRRARSDASELADKAFQELWETIPLDTLIFYAATTHIPEKEAPDWSLERLLEFLISCQKTGSVRNDKIILEGVIPAILNTAANALSYEPSRAAACIRQAHDAPPLPALAADASGISAIREMAQHYRHGTMGFLKSDLLARAWLYSGALDDDPQSTLLLAMDSFGEGDLAAAWHWAGIIALHEGVGREANRVGETIDKKVRELRPEGLTEQELARIQGYHKAKVERLEWRIAHEKARRR